MGAFSDKIYETRVLGRKSLRDIAQKIGISPMYLSELENGEKLPYKSDVIPKLADLYNIPREELLALLEEERKEQAIKNVQDGNLTQAFAAARKSEEVSKALFAFISNKGV